MRSMRAGFQTSRAIAGALWQNKHSTFFASLRMTYWMIDKNS
jgi:hypothetical protein